MATKTFKFKPSLDTASPENYRMAPSFGKDGGTGDVGPIGSNGSAVFFADYDMDNSYYRDVTLQKISSNKVLSSTSSSSLARPYEAGDIIISKSMSVYRISDNPTQNSKFSLEYMGRMSLPSSDSQLNINPTMDISMKVADDGVLWNGIYMGSTASGEDRVNAKKMPYAEIKVTLDDDSILDEYDVALEISMNGTKSLNAGSLPANDSTTPKYTDDPTSENMKDLIEFMKVIEIPVGRTIKVSLNEGDLLHPSKNEILGTVIEGAPKVIQKDGSKNAKKYASFLSYSNGLLMLHNAESAATGIMKELLNSSSSPMIRYSYIDSSMMNLRCGESRYFSGTYAVTDNRTPSSYSTYVAECNSCKPGSYSNALVDYICSPDNTFTLIVTRKSDGWMKCMDVNGILKINR